MSRSKGYGGVIRAYLGSPQSQKVKLLVIRVVFDERVDNLQRESASSAAYSSGNK